MNDEPAFPTPSDHARSPLGTAPSIGPSTDDPSIGTSSPRPSDPPDLRSPLTHFDAAGAAHMVDVGDKPATQRVATATGRITMLPATLALIATGSAKKGDVLGIARIAAIQGAKRTSELIPLCHPIAITKVTVELSLDDASSSVQCTATVACSGQTGVEMEALTAVQVGLLTVYDMCKAVDRGMTITDVRLLDKRGGKSGTWTAPAQAVPPGSR